MQSYHINLFGCRAIYRLKLHNIGVFTCRHSWLGNGAVRRLEAALGELEGACAAWGRRLSLACVPDLEALCREHLAEPQHWEANFKACKAYGQAVAKMTL